MEFWTGRGGASGPEQSGGMGAGQRQGAEPQCQSASFQVMFFFACFRVRLVVTAASPRTTLTGANGRYGGRSYGAQLSPPPPIPAGPEAAAAVAMEAWMDGQSEERKRWKRKRIVLHKEAVYCPAWNGEHKRRCSSRRRRRTAASELRKDAEAFAPSAASSTSMQQTTFKT